MRFSGHDTFIVRTFWLKKGYDFLKNGGSFSADDAVVHLGVGKNMVSAINFWMKAFGLIDETYTPTPIAEFLFDEKGVDPFLEDIGTIWLLHYLLIKADYSSIYGLVFNELRKERSVFTKRQLLSFIKRKFAENRDDSFNQNTIEKDISVLDRMYKKVDYKDVSKDFEEEISSLMIDLGLLSFSVEEEIKEGSTKPEKVLWYHLNGQNRPSLPPEIVLFSILDNFKDSKIISFKRLEIEPNSPGMVFLLNRDALYNILKYLETNFPGIVLSETAGNLVLVIPEGLDSLEILKNYYAN
jgi:hypothetical protein